MPYISVISPIYEAEGIIQELVKRISYSFLKITNDYEIILVEDGSADQSWEVIESLAKTNDKLKAIKLSRNFGQHYAITCGLRQAKGEWIVVMDCDLQDLPEEIPRLYEKAKQGYDLVFASRIVRQDSFFKRISSRFFYAFLGYMTDTEQDHTVANFGIYKRKVIKSILEMGDHMRYFPTMSQWVGFTKTKIKVKHGNRLHGNSTYTLKKLFVLALDNIIAFSDKPLRLTIKFGLTVSVSAFLIGFYYLYRYLSGDIEVLGYASLILSIWFLSGSIILVIGITGIYMGKIFESVKNRPMYIIDKTLNTEKDIL